LAQGRRNHVISSRINIANLLSALGQHPQALAMIALALQEAQELKFDALLPELYAGQMDIAQAAGDLPLVIAAARLSLSTSARLSSERSERA
jgi:hypothetical protein